MMSQYPNAYRFAYFMHFGMLLFWPGHRHLFPVDTIGKGWQYYKELPSKLNTNSFFLYLI